MRVTLIINTYNQPEYLSRVLRAVEVQILLPDEVLVADDGSQAETGQVVEVWGRRAAVRCEHVWQEHQGFRRSRILNEAIARARGEYVVFLDGDTVPHPAFVIDHRRLARPGRLVQGHRALVEKSAAAWFGQGRFAADRRRALLTGQLRGVQHAFRWPWPLRRLRHDLRGTRGCNLAIWRSDLVAVNGYNEAFEGWGREDSELVLRLQHHGLVRVDVRGWALCYHLWHPPAPRSQLAQNDALLEQARATRACRCDAGLDQHTVRPPESRAPNPKSQI